MTNKKWILVHTSVVLEILSLIYVSMFGNTSHLAQKFIVLLNMVLVLFTL